MANSLIVDRRSIRNLIQDKTRPRGWLIVFAEYIDARALRKHALFFAATIAVILIFGYYFGTFDQSVHIPDLKKFADPSLYPGDTYLDLRFQHYSYFWMLFQPFNDLGVLEIAMFVVHLVMTYLTMWALWMLSDQLFHNPLTNLISLVAFVLPHIGFGGWPLFEWSLLNRTFVLPFLIAAVILFLRGRVLFAFALVGLMYNLHALSANFALALMLFACLLEWRKIGWRKIVGGFALFVVCALPVLVWKLSGPGGNLDVNPAWFAVISLGMLYNNYALISTHPHIILATLSGLGTLGMFVIGRRYAPSREHNRPITLFMIAVLLILVVQFIVVTWVPVTLLVEFQLLRGGIWAMIFGLLYFANYLATQYESRTLPRADWNLLTASFLLSFLSFVAVLVWAIQRLVTSFTWRRLIGLTVALGVTAYGYAIALNMNLWQPGIYIYPPQTNWNDVQFWARDHTPKDTVFITPPEIWWMFTSDWRVFSERSSVVTFVELMEVGFAPNYLNAWEHRFSELAPGALQQLNGNPADNERIVAQAFYSLTDQDLLRVACEYRAAYLVVEKPHLRNFNVVYQNDGFVVYTLPLQQCPATSAALSPP